MATKARNSRKKPAPTTEEKLEAVAENNDAIVEVTVETPEETTEAVTNEEAQADTTDEAPVTEQENDSSEVSASEEPTTTESDDQVDTEDKSEVKDEEEQPKEEPVVNDEPAVKDEEEIPAQETETENKFVPANLGEEIIYSTNPELLKDARLILLVKQLEEYRNSMAPNSPTTPVIVTTQQRSLYGIYGSVINSVSNSKLGFDILRAYFKKYSSGAFSRSMLNRKLNDLLLGDEAIGRMLQLNSIFIGLGTHESKEVVARGIDDTRLANKLGTKFKVNNLLTYLKSE